MRQHLFIFVDDRVCRFSDVKKMWSFTGRSATVYLMLMSLTMPETKNGAMTRVYVGVRDFG